MAAPAQEVATVETIYAALLGYSFGSIPFGLLLTRMAGLGDVRQIGSGNIGATNVLRTGNKGLAAATLIADLVKGLVPVLIAARWFYQPDVAPQSLYGPMPMAALGAVLGHCFPVWLGFKGGKGVATNAGVSFGLGWPIGVAYGLIWLATLAITRTSSIAGMAAVVGAAAGAAIFGYSQFVPVLIVIALIIIWLHRANIQRIRAGEEPRVGGPRS